MNISELIQSVNSDYLDGCIPITEIQTSQDLKRIAECGAFHLTLNDWRSKYPNIAPEKVFYTRAYVGTMFYYDEKLHILRDLTGLLVKDIQATPEQRKESEASFLKHIATVKADMAAGKFLKSVLGVGGATQLHLVRDIIAEQPPSPEIYKLFINSYSHVDTGAGLLTEGTIIKAREGKSEEQIEATLNSLKDFPDEITIYRGEGSASTPSSKAYSWSTSERVAVFFATRFAGSAYRLVTAKVKKSDVIEHITDRNEEEVIVLPSKVYDKKTENLMTVDDLLNINQVPLVTAQEYVESFRGDEIYEGMTSDHDNVHQFRVTILAAYIAKHEKVRKFNEELMHAALFHDCGRTHEYEDPTHGADSYQCYIDYFPESPVVEYLMTYHCREDEEAKSALRSFSEEDRPHVWKAYCVLRDADALDRVRLGISDTLDPKYLHFVYSRKLIGVATELLRKFKI